MTAQRDLFGNIVEETVSKTVRSEKILTTADRETFQMRLTRLEYINEIWADKTFPLENSEFQYALEELKACFIGGHFIATIVLTNSFLERAFVAFFKKRGLSQISKYGFDNMVDYCKDYDLLPYNITQKIDTLRRIVHRFVRTQKAIIIEDASQKAAEIKKMAYQQLEENAKEVMLILLYILESQEVIDK